MPNFVTVFREATKRARALPHVFTMLLNDAAPFGGVTVALHQDRVVGVAIWFPPGTFRMTLLRQLRVVPTLLRVWLSDPGSFTRFASLGTSLQNLHPEAPNWYLAAIGVDPDMQGHGIGSALLRGGLATAEQAGEACYLETFSEANVRLYRRHGFEVLRDGVELVPGSPPFWLMWRDAPSA